MAYYLTHSISQFLLNNEKQRVRFLLARPVELLKNLWMNFCEMFGRIGLTFDSIWGYWHLDRDSAIFLFFACL